MRKSVKFLLPALLLAVVVGLGSCAAIASAMLEAAVLNDKTYEATNVSGNTVRFHFVLESGDGGNYKLDVTVGSNTYNSGYEWMLDTTNADAELKDIKIYRYTTTNGSQQIGTLRPDSIDPTRLTAVADFTDSIGAVTIPANKEFNLVD